MHHTYTINLNRIYAVYFYKLLLFTRNTQTITNIITVRQFQDNKHTNEGSTRCRIERNVERNRVLKCQVVCLAFRDQPDMVHVIHFEYGIPFQFYKNVSKTQD